MEFLLLYLIGAVGCTIVLTASSICAPIRRAACRAILDRIDTCPLYCSLCSGFWVGAVVGAAFELELGSGRVRLPTVLMFAFATSVVSQACSCWLRHVGWFTDPEHDGWRYGADGGFEDIDDYEEID